MGRMRYPLLRPTAALLPRAELQLSSDSGIWTALNLLYDVSCNLRANWE